jgi:hypothetical protein
MNTLSDTYFAMSEAVRKVTVNLPSKSLAAAMRITGKGVTPTLVEGLLELEKRAKRSALRNLKGKVRFELVLGETRR